MEVSRAALPLSPPARLPESRVSRGPCCVARGGRDAGTVAQDTRHSKGRYVPLAPWQFVGLIRVGVLFMSGAAVGADAARGRWIVPAGRRTGRGRCCGPGGARAAPPDGSRAKRTCRSQRGRPERAMSGSSIWRLVPAAPAPPH